MKTSIDIIKKMGELGILKTETVKDKKFDDVTFTNDMGIEKRVILDGITADDLPVLVALKQYETSKKIKSMVTFLIVLGLATVGTGLLFLLSYMF